MAQDPFETAKSKAQAASNAEQRKNEEYRKRCQDSSNKFYKLLKPKFAPHGYFFQIGGIGPSLLISPFDPGDRNADFEITGSHSGKGYYVRDQFGENVFEHDCDENRVMEMAGNFLGKSLNYKLSKEKLDKKLRETSSSYNNQSAEKSSNGGGFLGWLLCCIAIVALFIFFSSVKS